MSAAASSARQPSAPSPSASMDNGAHLPTDNLPILIIGIMAASLMQILDTTIANVAIPHMRTALGANAESITWVLTSYIIASAVALPITGWLADRFGARLLFIASVGGFIVASMLCGAAQNLEQMVIFRALQGVAGAFIAPLSQSYLLDTSPPGRHAQMMAIWGIGIMLGPILGPILGGWLTETASWRWVFYVNLPVGILALAILIAFLPHRDGRKRPFDFTGFFLIALALSALQLMLDRGHQTDWFDAIEIWIYALIFLCCGWMALVHMLHARHPLFERALFVDRNFLIALFFMAVIGVVMFAVMALMPPMLQNLFGYGVIDTGLVLMPRGIGVLISMQLSGLLMRKGVDARPVVFAGMLISAFSLWQMAHWSLALDQYHIVISGLIQGLGMGLVFIPLNVTAFATLSPKLRTDGSSLLNLIRSLGASAGISLTTALLARNLQIAHADIAPHISSESLQTIDLSTIDRYQYLGDLALWLINGEINRQAAMVAYIDDFWAMMWFTLAAAPLAFLMSRSDPAMQAELEPLEA